MDDKLASALEEALRASEAEQRRRRDVAAQRPTAPPSTFNRDIGGVSVVMDFESRLPPVPHRERQRRTVANALASLPGGAGIKVVFVALREIVGVGLLFWLVAVALSMWQTSPLVDVLTSNQSQLMAAFGIALVLRLGWWLSRRAIIDALAPG